MDGTLIHRPESTEMTTVTPPALHAVCVFCGSSPGLDPRYASEATRFGRLLAENSVSLVYGGGAVGLMGAVANGALTAGGHVVGIIPRFLLRAEVGHEHLSERIVVETMHERKMAMFERADAFVVLPGGIGTLEELFEILSWRTLALHAKPMVVIEGNGYWDPLKDLIERCVAARFARPELHDYIRFVDTIDAVLPTLTAMPFDPRPSKVEKT
ncbi:TIGR00730 family Rossman fold protein [Reyranella sp. CPCC 100927]|uniref:LOG family protein n=1 Tax=Reyranella sp. CPCC 100927 TaxID=2599616 RepID=UPI002104084B|nr:TIGR00730 family Rossman fold protein [Reyranella sp. CPCC 100927]